MIRPSPAPSATLLEHLEASRKRIDDALRAGLAPAGATPEVLHEAVRYTLLLPGKRLRAVLVLDACALLRGEPERAIPLACAVEMVHAASLIVDDLPSMDDATLRRGQPALHRKVGEANAILASIALLNRAFGTIVTCEVLRDRERARAAALLAEAVGDTGLVGGQVADLAATGKRIELDELEHIHGHRTGALFVAAVRLGALAAKGRERDVLPLHLYAKSLGLAFQITDDLLDYSGDPAKTGKDSGLDRDRTTFVNLAGIHGARRRVDELIDASLEALRPFGKRAARLVGLAELVRERDR